MTQGRTEAEATSARERRPGAWSFVRSERSFSPRGTTVNPAAVQAAAASVGTHSRSMPACFKAGAVSTGWAQ